MERKKLKIIQINMARSMIKIVQLNLNSQRVASLQLRDFCAHNKINIALVQEPVALSGKIYGFEDCRTIAADNPGAAIIIMDKDIQAIELSRHMSTHIAAIRVGHGLRSLVLVSAYFKYNVHTSAFTDKLRTILEDGAETIIGADTNGHSPRWYSRDLNHRGRVVEDLIDDFNLSVINRAGMLDTYARPGMGSSNIDVTLSTHGSAGSVTGWLVSDVTDSDHRLLSYTVDQMAPIVRREKRFDVRRANWDLFTLELSREVGTVQSMAGVNEHASSLMDVIIAAATKAIPVKADRRWAISRQPWWTDRLTTLRKLLNRSKRMGLSHTNRPEYNRQRNEYLHEIRKSKMESWRHASDDINANIWGKAFRYAKNGPRMNNVTRSLTRLDGSHTETVEDTMDVLLDTFVPVDLDQVESTWHGPLELFVPVTEQEVKDAIWRMKPSKAPGLDGITAGMLRKAWPVIRETTTSLMNNCLESATFPNCWKVSKLVIIPKPGKKDTSSPKAYRPISLLQTMSKALETLIISDINRETSLNDIGNQHGFVTGRSTITAMNSLYDWVNESRCRYVFGVFLDITGAFDNVKWSPILERLHEIGASVRTIRLISNYLDNRFAKLQIEKVIKTKRLTRGCPQGSQLGPTLWKVAMSDIETSQDERSQHVITYADDIAALMGAARPPVAFKRMTAFLDTMKDWAGKYSLEFSTTKTQLMSVKGGLKPNYNITFGTSDGAAVIEPTKTVRYLGILLDPRQSYVDHIISLAHKSKDLYKRLRGMTSANWGMSRRTAKIIYEGVFLPRITYAAEIWWEGVHFRKCREKLGSMQRDPLRAITSAYNTASTNCLSVVAGELPLDLKIIEHVFKRKMKLGLITPEALREKQDDLLRQWQDRYIAADGGAWTKKMIPSAIDRYHLPLEMDHYTTQFLTGHGDFRAKLFSFSLVDSPTCRCALGGSETVAHVLLVCKRTEQQRDNLKSTLLSEGQTWPPEDGVFLRSRKLYDALRTFAKESLRNREDR